MIFTTQCPSCEATFPIDAAKVPDEGVYARCSQCDGVFLVEVPVAEDTPPTETQPIAELPEAEIATAEAPSFDAPEAPESFEASPEPIVETEPEPDPPIAVEVEPVLEAEPEPEAAPEPAIEMQPDPEPAFAPAVDPAPVAAPSFGKRDPSERAQRLARVLVSDMIAYHPDRHRRSLEEGTLKPDFEEEIEKSWNEYVDQVGKEIAESTTYFTDALNEILAKGELVF